MRPAQRTYHRMSQMRTDRPAYKSIDEYIASFPPEVQPILQTIRATIRKAAPDAKEKISYRIPTFTLNGNLVHFAAFKKHIGFYPPVRSDKKLMSEISIYANERGNLRFPFDKRIPYALIRRIVKVRIRENLERAKVRKIKSRFRSVRT
jgi:uncharacterized protein YdhG (YjbR/CyaY superfamily)